MENTLPREPLLSRPGFALLYALALVLASAGAIRATLAAHADRELSRTGSARWIWYSREIKEPLPISFVATRDVVLGQAPARATAKVFADRWHVLWVNGHRAGAGTQQPGAPLALYEIGPLLRPGVNRIAIEAGSETGAFFLPYRRTMPMRFPRRRAPSIAVGLQPVHLPARHAHRIVNYLSLNFFDAVLSGSTWTARTSGGTRER